MHFNVHDYGLLWLYAYILCLGCRVCIYDCKIDVQVLACWRLPLAQWPGHQFSDPIVSTPCDDVIAFRILQFANLTVACTL